MDHTKDTLLELIRGTLSTTIYNQGVYILNIEEILDNYKRRMFHAGFFYYMLVESGTAKFMINCHSLTLKKGDMLLVTPRMSVSLKSKSMEFNSYGICIEPSFFDSLAVGSYAYKSLYNAGSMTLALQLDNDDFAYVHKTLELLAHSLTFNYPVEMMSYLVNFLLLQITKIVDNQSARSSGKISRPDELFRLFRKLLAEHYRHEHTIAFYADRLHVSRPYLSRIIRQVSGKTVNIYIMEALLSEAKRLLTFTDLAIKGIAESLGFADQSSFGKFFKKGTGMSPLNFRNKNQTSIE